MRYCTQCGAQNPDSSKFCVNCGVTLEAMYKPKVNYAKTIEKKSNRAVMVMSVLLVVLIALIGMDIYMDYLGNTGYDIESVINQEKSDPEEFIVGQWKSSDEDGIFYDEIEFFSNGTHVTEVASWSGEYTIDGDRLSINGRWYSQVFTFEISNDGDELILTNKKGYSIVYNRVN